MRLITLFFITALTLWAQILSPEEAFKTQIVQNDSGVEVRVELGEGIYLYEEEFKITLHSKDVTLLNPSLELPQAIEYDGFQVYPNSLHVKIPWEILGSFGIKNGDSFGVEVAWQGCSKQGLCYQPMNERVDFGEPIDNKQQISEHDAIAQAFNNQGSWWILVSFFGFGLLLSLTPCVFPMIPILSSIIVAQGGEKLGSKRGFMLAFVYVLAMAVAYSVAGVLAGLFGANIQALLQTPWVIWLFSAIFILLSLSMFGLYELQLPAFLRQKLAPTNGSQSGGIISVAIMGLLSALIVGPCVAAPLAGALLYIGQSGDALLGGAALFVMSMGMGVPLLLIGASAGKLLPKPGPWMDATKAFFGVMLLGLAIWMLERVMPTHISLILYGILAISTAIYMGALEPSRDGGWWRLWKSVAWIVLLYGAMLFVGGMAKGENPLNPLKPFVGGAMENRQELKFTYVRSVAELEDVVKKSTNPVMVDFYADWCVNCKELEQITFKDPKVRAMLETMTLLKVDVTANGDEDRKLLKKFNLFGPPGLIFYQDGQELKSLQIVGYIGPREFEKHLQNVLQF